MSHLGRTFISSGKAPGRVGLMDRDSWPWVDSYLPGSRSPGREWVVTTGAPHKQDRQLVDDGVAQDQDLRTYVLDTSVLLSDPRAYFRFAEHNVVIPVVVITELEGKRHDPEIGYFARQALRHLDELRVEHRRLDFPVPVGQGGTLRVELTNTDASVLPSGMRLGDNDSRILAVALNLAADGQEVTVVSKDLPMRVKAASLGIIAEEYLAEQAADSGWTGISSIDVSGDDLSDLYESDVAMSDDARGLPSTRVSSSTPSAVQPSGG